MDHLESDRPEIAFFDVETTIPTRPGQGYALLEFGAILVCPKKLTELESYSVLLRPSNTSLITPQSVRCNGITKDAVSSAVSFLDVSDKVYELLHGRVWAGHNILRFDCPRIKEAFAGIGKAAPEPKGIVDSLALLTQKFGRRAGDMKMASLANYFGLGQQSHRSLDDVRMNLEVVKYCATVLFLESCLPDIFMIDNLVSPNAATEIHSNGKTSASRSNINYPNSPSSSITLGNDIFSIPTYQLKGENHLTPSPVESNAGRLEPFDFGQLINEINTETFQPDNAMEENPLSESPEISSITDVPQGCSNFVGFLEPDEVSIPSISASLVPFYRGSQKIHISHKDAMLQLYSPHMRVKFGISTKFLDYAGRPRLNVVVNASPSLCRVLDACDDVAKKLSSNSGSSCEWRPIVIRKNDYLNSCTIRMNIPTVVNGVVAMYGTEIYRKVPSSDAQKLVFSKIDVAELDALFTPGTYVDTYFSLDPYDYQQSAGIRLVAKKLIIHSA